MHSVDCRLGDESKSMRNDDLVVVPFEDLKQQRPPNQVVTSLRDVMEGKVVVPSALGERDQKRPKFNSKPKKKPVVEVVALEKSVDADDNDDDNEDDDDEDEEEEDVEDEKEDRRKELDAINRTEGLMQGAPKYKKKGRAEHVKIWWSAYDTDMFFDNLRLWGTDFLLGNSKFPKTRDHRSFLRKLHHEEKANAEAVNWALDHPLPVPDGMNPDDVPLPCQLEGYSKEDLDAYYKVLLATLKKNAGANPTQL